MVPVTYEQTKAFREAVMMGIFYTKLFKAPAEDLAPLYEALRIIRELESRQIPR